MDHTTHGLLTLAAVALLGAGTGQAASITNSASGNWHVGGTWIGSVAPGSGDNATIVAGTTVTVAEASTAYTVIDLTVSGTLNHLANAATELYKVDLTVLGDLTVGSTGAIDVKGRGYSSGFPVGNGPAPGDQNDFAASHGGLGAIFTSNTKTTYGSITNPTTLGSGGGHSSAGAGGGAIVLRVSGAASIDGRLRADAGDSLSDFTEGGAGGTVNLRADTLSGSGIISANGNTNTLSSYRGGGGGRVAVKLVSGTDTGGVALRALGGRSSSAVNNGGAGTIYLQTAGVADGQGRLIVDAGGIASGGGASTLISSNVTDAFAGDVIMGTNSLLAIATSGSLAMSGVVRSIVTNPATATLKMVGGTLTVPAAFSFSNATIQISNPSTFSPATSLTVPSNAVLTIDVPHTLSGNLVVEAGGRVTHSANNDTNTAHYMIDLTIGGNLTVAGGGTFDAKGRGYLAGKGFAPGSQNNYAASHGGEGRGHATPNPKTTYGSITNPTTLGSGGSLSAGGGAIFLKVSGSASIDGTVTADAADLSSTFHEGAAGGSVCLSADTLGGSGTISANGNTNGITANYAGGGGGRVAVKLSSGPSIGGVLIRALGGKSPTTSMYGAPGMIYLQTGLQANGGGALTVDAGGFGTGTSASTLISSNVTGAVVGDVRIQNGARLALATNVAISVAGSWSNAAAFTAATGSVVSLTGVGTGTVYGTSTFQILAMTNAGKTVYFEASQTNWVNESLQIQGATLRSTSDGAWWHLRLAGAAAQDVKNVTVKDSNATNGQTIVALGASQDLSHNVNWSFPTAPGSVITIR